MKFLIIICLIMPALLNAKPAPVSSNKNHEDVVEKKDFNNKFIIEKNGNNEHTVRVYKIATSSDKYKEKQLGEHSIEEIKGLEAKYGSLFAIPSYKLLNYKTIYTVYVDLTVGQKYPYFSFLDHWRQIGRNSGNYAVKLPSDSYDFRKDIHYTGAKAAAEKAMVLKEKFDKLYLEILSKDLTKEEFMTKYLPELKKYSGKVYDPKTGSYSNGGLLYYPNVGAHPVLALKKLEEAMALAHKRYKHCFKSSSPDIEQTNFYKVFLEKYENQKKAYTDIEYLYHYLFDVQRNAESKVIRAYMYAKKNGTIKGFLKTEKYQSAILDYQRILKTYLIASKKHN